MFKTQESILYHCDQMTSMDIFTSGDSHCKRSRAAQTLKLDTRLYTKHILIILTSNCVPQISAQKKLGPFITAMRKHLKRQMSRCVSKSTPNNWWTSYLQSTILQ